MLRRASICNYYLYTVHTAGVCAKRMSRIDLMAQLCHSWCKLRMLFGNSFPNLSFESLNNVFSTTVRQFQEFLARKFWSIDLFLFRWVYGRSNGYKIVHFLESGS